MSFGGGKQKQRTVETTQQTQQQQQAQQQVQQTQIPALTPAEFQSQQAAQQSELFRMFLMQRLAQEQFQAPLMTPHAQQGLDVLNRQFSDQQDMRGLQGNASPIENARAMGISQYLAQLQNDAFQKRLAMSGALQPSAGGLGLMSLQQQRAIAGSPTTTNFTGNTNFMNNAMTQRNTTGTGMYGEGNIKDIGTASGYLGNLYGLYKGLGQGSQGAGLTPAGGYGGGYNYGSYGNIPGV